MPAPSTPSTRHLQYLLIPLVLALAVIAWNLVAALGGYPEFILPRARFTECPRPKDFVAKPMPRN